MILQSGNAFDEEEITATVISYFREHPRAKDTLEGIFQFWLTRQRARDALPVLQRVLSRLTCDGVLREEYQAGTVYYTLAVQPGN